MKIRIELVPTETCITVNLVLFNEKTERTFMMHWSVCFGQQN